MTYTTYQRPSFGFGRTWTRMVKILILTNAGVFLLQTVLFRLPLAELLGLDTAHPLQLWRYITYLFLHGGPFHLLFNMFALWIFGSDLEDHFGSERFLQYYFFTGIGAGITVALLDLVFGQRSLVIGASGAVFGLLLAFGIVYAERTITMLLFLILPVTMKARHFVILFGIVEFFFGISRMGTSNVAHFAHLGGMAFGYLYFRSPVTLSAGSGKKYLRSLQEQWRVSRGERDEKRMDDLLRKVNEKGIGSLTEEEKEFLHRMSRSKRWQ